MDKLKNYAILLLLLVLVAVLGVGALKKRDYDKHVVDLQNQIAAQSKTIEDNKGLYEKLVLQESNVSNLLASSDTQVKELKAQLSKSNEQLASAVQLTLQLKQQQATVSGTQTVVQPTKPGTLSRTKVAFDKDFGTVKVDGFTLTNPGEASLTLSPSNPLKLTVAMSQDKSKAWHAYATSSDPNIGVNIGVAAVDPYIDQPKWYEHIGVDGDLAGGGQGLLAGVGLSYQLGKFEIGPKVFATITDRADLFYGLGFIWHPFQSQ